jgi:hypothetical protein
MRFLFNLSSFHTKFALFILMTFVFFMLYNTLPEFDLQIQSTNLEDNILNKLLYTISNQVGYNSFNFTPRTNRGKIITIIHLIISFSLLLL